VTGAARRGIGRSAAWVSPAGALRIGRAGGVGPGARLPGGVASGARLPAGVGAPARALRTCLVGSTGPAVYRGSSAARPASGASTGPARAASTTSRSAGSTGFACPRSDELPPVEIEEAARAPRKDEE